MMTTTPSPTKTIYAPQRFHVTSLHPRFNLPLIWLACAAASTFVLPQSKAFGSTTLLGSPPSRLQSLRQRSSLHFFPCCLDSTHNTPMSPLSSQACGLHPYRFGRSRQRLQHELYSSSFGLEDVIFSAQNTASSLADTVISSGSGSTNLSSAASLQSLLILYTAGLWTSFSPCSLGLLPITLSYISSAAKERKDSNTILPTLAFAAGLALVFTALGVSASALGGVFGSSASGGEVGGSNPLGSLLLAAFSSLISVLMGLQLLDIIRIPLPSLGDRWRVAPLSDGTAIGGGDSDASGGSLFDENGGLVLNKVVDNQLSISGGNVNNAKKLEEEGASDEIAALFRTFLLGGTSALVASPCATPVLATLLAFLASASASSSSFGDVWKGATWMLSYTLGYSTPLLVIGAAGGQALVDLQKATRGENGGIGSLLGQWITPLTGSVLIMFGMNGFLVALLGDPSLAGLAPIIE